MWGSWVGSDVLVREGLRVDAVGWQVWVSLMVRSGLCRWVLSVAVVE